METFEEQYNRFIQFHLSKRTGERRGRLERGHLHAEKCFAELVWWPLFGNFDGLHPEFEIQDWRGRSYFGDYAYFCWPLKFIIEIKGFNSHVRDMDRKKYSEELNRETFLHALGFIVISFSYDDVVGNPQLCITLLRMLLSRFTPGAAPVNPLLLAEKEVFRLALSLARPVRPVDVEKHFGINHRTAVRYLQGLCAKGWLRAIAGSAEPQGTHREGTHRETKGPAKAKLRPSELNPQQEPARGKVMRYEPVHGVWDFLD